MFFFFFLNKIKLNTDPQLKVLNLAGKRLLLPSWILIRSVVK